MFPKLESLLAQWEKVLETVHAAIVAHLGGAGTFPVRVRLRGTYHIGDEAYWINDEPWFASAGRSREFRFSMMARLNEHATQANSGGANLKDLDYYGLEIQFAWHPEQERFEFSGDVDSSSI